MSYSQLRLRQTCSPCGQGPHRPSDRQTLLIPLFHAPAHHDNPSLTTASSDFVTAASTAPGWRGERWPGRLVAPTVTLDQLIEGHGEPTFVKIDLEGFEAEALAGLSRPLEAFSFEFTTILRRVAIDCLTRCRALGAYRFNAALGETQRLAFPQWIDAEAIEQWLEALSDNANSGDIYVRRRRSDNSPRNLPHGRPHWRLQVLC